MCIAGLFVGAYKGWSLALVMLSIMPLMMCGMIVFATIMQSNQKASDIAYG
jgi:hypothetical protein